MLNTAMRFMSECDRVGLKYRDSRDLEDGSSMVVCGVSGKNNARYDVLFIFDKDQHTVSERVVGLVSFEEERDTAVRELVNELNGTYRWFKFYVKQPGRVSVQADAIISEDTADRICVELLIRTMKVIDEVYPKFMHVLWGNQGVGSRQ